MTSNGPVIAPLDVSSSLPRDIAGIQFALWGPLTGYSSAADYECFLRTTSSSALPTVLAATLNGAFVGSVNLLAHEMTTRPDLTPWMAQLFVLALDRGSGFGRALVRAAIDHAAALGYRRLHLFTSGTLPQFYTSLGWQEIEWVDYLGKPRTIMAVDIAPPEARD